MYTIKALCREYHLSRSTLLYYDSIGLLKPTQRTRSNYREYSEEDRLRLDRICTYREAGIPLEQIKAVLEADRNKEQDVLTDKLQKLNNEIKELRLQQRMIVEMLRRNSGADVKLLLDRTTFIDILSSLGFSVEEMDHFHHQFEKKDPEAHHFFLEFLGLSKEDIKAYKESF